MNTVETQLPTDPQANNLRYFNYNQNNSGGSFHRDDSVTYNVIIQARSLSEANMKAEAVGIYFDGCDSGRDCSCCGDRWYRPWDEKGTATPMIYDKPPLEHDEMFCKVGEVYCYVYNADGTKNIYRKGEK